MAGSSSSYQHTEVKASVPLSPFTTSTKHNGNGDVGRVDITCGIGNAARSALLAVAGAAVLFCAPALSNRGGGDHAAVTLLRAAAPELAVDATRLIGAPWEGGGNAAVPDDSDSNEGRYDWQKCKNSSDPDCWSEEATRVSDYWKHFDFGTADPPEPDVNGEGIYHWKECQASNDPDCWEEEGRRVGSYWKTFSDKVSSSWKHFWTPFADNVKHFFAGVDKATTGEETNV